MLRFALFGLIVVLAPVAFGDAGLNGQCGGLEWDGSFSCVSPYYCNYITPCLSRCQVNQGPSGPPPPAPPPPLPPVTTLADMGQSIGWKYVGSATNGPIGNCTDPQYAAIFLEEFNMATTGTALTWRETEPSQGYFNFTMADEMVRWAQNYGLMLRGQPLAWHAELPDWLSSTGDVESALQNHVSRVVGQYAGAMCMPPFVEDAWDVVNEAFLDDGSFRPSLLYQRLGDSYIETAFAAARDADPDARLYINEDLGAFPSPKATAVLNLIKYLSRRGLQVNGVGVQAHFEVGKVPATLADTLAYFTKAGVEVAITELDIRLPIPSTAKDLSQQRRDYQAVFAACKKVVNCVGVTVWGVTDKYSWIPKAYSTYGNPLPWDAAYKKKPAYQGAAAGILF